MTADRSNGWEAVAGQLVASRSRIGVDVLRTWSRMLPRGAAVLDLGCGAGAPVSTTLRDEGFAVHGVDASPTLVAAWRRALPGAPVACEAVEESTFFGRSFDAAVAVGLLFLLPADVQRALIPRVAAALVPGGRFLFTSPAQACRWHDSLTGRLSVSLGRAAYLELLGRSALELAREHVDEGDNHYYDTVRSARL